MRSCHIASQELSIINGNSFPIFPKLGIVTEVVTFIPFIYSDQKAEITCFLQLSLPFVGHLTKQDC